MMMNLLAANIARMRSNMLFRVGILFGAFLGIICPLGAELGFWLSELTNGMVSLGLIAEKPILDYYFFTWTILSHALFIIYRKAEKSTENFVIGGEMRGCKPN